MSNKTIVLALTMALILTFVDPIKGQSDKVALIVIDMQDCFISGGNLAVNEGNDIIPIINRLRTEYADFWSLVVLSQDWHPVGHVSFASSHPDSPNPISLQYTTKGQLCTKGAITAATFPGAVSCSNGTANTETLQQALWPDHCIQNVSTGPASSDFAPGLLVGPGDLIIRKGTKLEVDSYSAFFDNGGFGKTTLDNELRKRGITQVFVTGLAADYCVYYTSLDAQKLGYETYYVMDATRPVTSGTYKAAINDLSMKGVHLITSSDIPTVFKEMGRNTSSQPLLSPTPLFITTMLTIWLLQTLH